MSGPTVSAPATGSARAALSEQYAVAARTLARVLGGESLASAPGDESAQVPRAVRAGARSFLYAALRAGPIGPALLDALLHRPITDPVLRGLLFVALVDLRANSAHAHTIVDQAVRAAVRLGREPARGLVNAILRSYLRQAAALEARLAAQPDTRFQHPAWWVERLRTAYPDRWQDILEAGNRQGPLCVRVNRRATTVSAYRAALTAAGLSSTGLGDAALRVDPAVPVEALPGFDEGWCSVQDAGAQRAAPLLDLRDGQRVLDACAAPGGKTAHILELASVDLLALDVDPGRAARIEDNLARLRLRARVRVGDAADPAAWWDGRRFDRILADLPCSASGVVRRHPDVKWLRRAGDLRGFARTQRALLLALWPLLAPGGRLVYATCSVFPEENEQLVDALIPVLEGAVPRPLEDLPRGRLLPAEDHDGFYYAVLEKRPE